MVKRRINSRQKGVAGEREWRDYLRAVGFSTARRGQQFKGTKDSPDVICEQFPIMWEVKRRQKLSLWEWICKIASETVDTGRFPAVAHRKNDEQWLVTMEAGEFFSLLFRIHERGIDHVEDTGVRPQGGARQRRDEGEPADVS